MLIPRQFLFPAFLCLLAFTQLVGCDHAWPTKHHATQVESAQADAIESEAVRQVSIRGPRREPVRSMPQLENSIVIGLDADMSSASAHSGESIRRGVMVAVDEINEMGGLLGRPLEVVVRDHRGNPARGIDNINELACFDNLIAIVGGIHTPVALEELDAIHDNEVIYLGPWAAGTPLTSNGRDPNFVFRVSVRDEYAGEFLVSAALDRGLEKIGLLLERTGWGRSNHTAMTQALESRGLEPTAVEWFHWGEPHLANQVNALLDAGCETVLLVCNPLEGVTAVRTMADIPSARRIPILSHWGLTGGKLPELAADSLRKVDLVFLQTYSFIDPSRPDRAGDVLERYSRLFPECTSARDVFAPVGTAHAYELVHMLAAAVRSCGSLDRQEVRRSLEALTEFDGLIRHYERPFLPGLHDALTIEDFHLAHFDEDGVIVVDKPRKGVDQP